MDGEWDFRLWSPSEPAMSIGSRRPSKQEVEDIRSQLKTSIQGVKDTPYLNLAWLERAANLSQLGFPELAATDAYKAILLCNAGLESKDWLGDIARYTTALNLILVFRDGHMDMNRDDLQSMVTDVLLLVRAQGYVILVNNAFKLRAYVEVIKICNEGLKYYPTNADFLHKIDLAKNAFNRMAASYVAEGIPFEKQKQFLSWGFSNIRTYPWVTTEHRYRSTKTIEACKEGLKKWSNCLEIRSSPMGDIQASTDPEKTCYGMFATRRIHMGELVLTETHPFAVSLEQPKSQCTNCFQTLASFASVHSMTCCPNYKYCSSTCEKAAKDNYHNSMCGKDFSRVIDRAHHAYGGKWEGKGYAKGTTELSQLTGWNDKVTDEYAMSDYCFPDQVPVHLIRVLAVCIQAGYHPLSHPNIAQLVSNESAELIWSFNGMVSGPIEVLQTFGIDVFANEDFDTWVLLTAWYRIKNNSAFLPLGFPNRIMSPSYCWFNHSCDPSAASVAPESGRSCDAAVVALRTIEKGEEVFVSYIGGDALSFKKGSRRELLRSWLDKDCACERCQGEA